VGGELVGEENLPEEGLAVIVANHMGVRGPIGVFCSLPMRLYPWTKLETMDKNLAPQQVRLDLPEGELKLKPPLSGMVSRAICAISVPFLHSLGCIPVYHTRQELEATFQQSLALLRQGEFLIVTPENPQQDPDPVTGIHPFKKGFLRMGELYAQETGQRLQFYPVAVHETGKVFVGKPIAYNPLNEAESERSRLVNLQEETIKAMYAEVTATYSMALVLSKK
jgi:hypothetical protein